MFFFNIAALKFMKAHEVGAGFELGMRTTDISGLWPSVFNVAAKSLIKVNATCGESGREEFCRMSETRNRCGVCDNYSHDPGRRHPIYHAIDSTKKWWQSPALYYGREFEYVTVTIDLKQVSETLMLT